MYGVNHDLAMKREGAGCSSGFPAEQQQTFLLYRYQFNTLFHTSQFQ
jgi:hypothetical protein